MNYSGKLVLFLLLFFCRSDLIAQQTITVATGDSVKLSADQFTGDLQWQRSPNQLQWTDVTGADRSPFTFRITEVPVYFRARITKPDCEPHYSEIITVIRSERKYWSDPETWPSGKPTAGQNVVIPEGVHIVLDENPPSLGTLTIEGTLEFEREDLQLSAMHMLVHGRLEIGSEAEPFENKAILTLTGTNTSTEHHGGDRGIVVMGGALELHGAVPQVVWTKLNGHAQAGATQLSLAEPVDWKANDEIVVAPTDYYGIAQTEKLMITRVSNDVLTAGPEIQRFRWGVLQYATTGGMSLSPADLVSPPLADTDTEKTPVILDERAPVGCLTRNIVIQGPDDDAWTNQGFGVHIMIMSGGEAHVEGIEIRRGGQRNKLRRYPFHWHNLSYSGTQTLSDAEGQYIRNSVVNSSANRGIVIHGTNGVSVVRNIVYDVRGHGIFFEDAAERRNTIDGNLVLRIRSQAANQSLKLHERASGTTGASGYWISNPDNTIVNNTAADCDGFGFWLAYPANPWGDSQTVLAPDGQVLDPSKLLFGTFDNNTSHSNRLQGIMLDNVETDNEGTTVPRAYWSTTTGRNDTWPYSNTRRFTLSRYLVFKNLSNGIWDRSNWVNNFGAVSADNCGRFFAGAGDDGIIRRCLVIGTSLNHMMSGTGRPAQADFAAGHASSDPAAFATYHSTFDIDHNIVINFPPAAERRSGVFSTDDYYLRAVDKGQVRNINNLVINSHPGVKLKPPFNPAYFALAGTLWDPHGTWGPAGNYLVYDEPFFTYGKTITPVDPPGISGGVSVEGPFYGFGGFVLKEGDNQYMPLMAMAVDRLNPQNLNEVVGTWSIPQAPPGNTLLTHMRHFATSPGGIYRLTFPNEDHPTRFQMNVLNMLTEQDTQVMGIQFSGENTDISVTLYVNPANPNSAIPYQQRSSLQDVINSDGATYWQDAANNRVYVNLRGGFFVPGPGTNPFSDENLYRTGYLTIRRN